MDRFFLNLNGISSTFLCLLQIQYFLQFVKSVYSELPQNLPKIFEPRPPLRVKDLSEINIDALLKETFTITAIQSEKKAADGTVVTVSNPRVAFEVIYGWSKREFSLKKKTIFFFFSVQSHSEGSIIPESAPGATDHRRANEPIVQAERARGCLGLHPPGDNDDHSAAEPPTQSVAWFQQRSVRRLHGSSDQDPVLFSVRN